MQVMIGYLVVINAVTFAVYALDKRRAKGNRWRIPERTLLLLSLAGGSLGAFLAMRICHHKTRKQPFSVGVPLMLVLHIVCVAVALSGLTGRA